MEVFFTIIQRESSDTKEWEADGHRINSIELLRSLHNIVTL